MEINSSDLKAILSKASKINISIIFSDTSSDIYILEVVDAVALTIVFANKELDSSYIEYSTKKLTLYK